MKKLLLMSTALVAFVSAPALAIFGPMPVVDLDSISKEVQMVEHQLQQIEQTKQLVQSEVQNLAKIPTSYQEVQAEVSAIAQTSKQVAAEARGTVAAGTVVADSSEQAAETARLNGLAAQANGAQQQAIVANGYLAQQTLLLEQGNVLQAQAQLQAAAKERAAAQAIADSGTGLLSAAQSNAPSNMP